MVQSARLKNKIHPIFPIILVISFISFLGFVALPQILKRNGNEYEGYRAQRSTLVTKYNELNTSLKSVLEFRYVSNDQYLEGLKRAFNIISEIKSTLSTSSNLSIKILDTRLEASRVDEVENDLSELSSQLGTITAIESQIKNKMEAISVIESIQNLTYCLKAVKDRYDLQECEYISENVKSPAILSSIYKKNTTLIFSKYFDYSKNERVKRINWVISEHNKMNSSLQSMVNSPIVY
jgi:hypothetical protein